MRSQIVEEFIFRFQKKPEIHISAPGRINIIGEHTDYTGGYVLPSAIDRRIQFVAAPCQGSYSRIYSKNYDEEHRISLNDFSRSQKSNWIEYIKGILWVLKKRGYQVGGFDAFITGDVPEGAGLSSSAALQVSVLKGISDLYHLGLKKQDLALFSQKAENEFIGLQCGIMDPFVSTFAKSSHAVFLDCETLENDYVSMKGILNRIDIIICDSKVRRELTSTKYNQRREEAFKARSFFQKSGQGSLKRVTDDFLEKSQNQMAGDLYRRARHIISENKRVKEMIEAIEKKDLHHMGDILFRSHKSLRDDFEVSCPELDFFVETLRELPDGLGARMTGAGFGGSGIALVKKGTSSRIRKILVKEAGKRGLKIPSVYRIKIDKGVQSHFL